MNPTSPHTLRILLEPKINCFNDEFLLRNIVRQIELLSNTVAPENHRYFLLLTLRQYHKLFIPTYPGCWGAVHTGEFSRKYTRYRIKLRCLCTTSSPERTCPDVCMCAVGCVLWAVCCGLCAVLCAGCVSAVCCVLCDVSCVLCVMMSDITVSLISLQYWVRKFYLATLHSYGTYALPHSCRLRNLSTHPEDWERHGIQLNLWNREQLPHNLSRRALRKLLFYFNRSIEWEIVRI